MRNFFSIYTLVCTAIFISSCVKSSSTIQEESSSTTETTFSIEVISRDNNYVRWIVTSKVAEPTYEEFAELRSALNIAESSGTQVFIEFYNVTHIPDYALYYGDTSSSSFSTKYSSALVSVSGDSVTHIGANAFAGEESHYGDSTLNLESASFPNAVEIGYYAFSRCVKLTNINLPKLKIVSEYLFSDCISLTSISLPSATTIERCAFRHCYELSELHLAEGAAINDYAFLGLDTEPTITYQ